MRRVVVFAPRVRAHILSPLCRMRSRSTFCCRTCSIIVCIAVCSCCLSCCLRSLIRCSSFCLPVIHINHCMQLMCGVPAAFGNCGSLLILWLRIPSNAMTVGSIAKPAGHDVQRQRRVGGQGRESGRLAGRRTTPRASQIRQYQRSEERTETEHRTPDVHNSRDTRHTDSSP